MSRVFLDVISYEGDNQTLIYKFPEADFNTLSQLVVHESQQAILMKDGQMLQTFGPGRYTMDTKNIPLLREFVQLPFADHKSPFHCEIYFINLAEQLNVHWGTNQAVEYIDPNYNVVMNIGLSGTMSIKIKDGRFLLKHLVGTEELMSRDGITGWLKNICQSKLKAYIASYMQKPEVSIFNMDTQLEHMSKELQLNMEPVMGGYGFQLMYFVATNFVRPQNCEGYNKIKDLMLRQRVAVDNALVDQKLELIQEDTEAKKLVIEAKGLAEKRVIEGFTYQQERQFDIMEKLAANQGIGDFSNAGIGVGMMASLGNVMATQMTGVLQQSMNAAPVPAGAPSEGGEALFCVFCGKPVNKDYKFCPFCGKEK
ncbi:SPFH domain-containing protein [Anaerovibrio sp. RM50]|uniref:SPFH domain-containing protein n=1 Tax=Anaerovibrio sp. RM50 TaxID=1200557 RepID=UPI000685584E|nr:SPFH domain-containing protein [Anaerovibrio sp. RM50]